MPRVISRLTRFHRSNTILRRRAFSRVGELLRCGWHGWEFDMRTGQSWFDPKRVKVRTCPVVIEDGETLAKGPYVAETFPVSIEGSYVVIDINT
jgi:3-phenylpropionate/trans-cinnamate dioxygenase ferredoxin subunit